jgi:hypothetical protein
VAKAPDPVHPLPANIGPHLFHQNPTLMADIDAHSNSRPSTVRKLSENRTNISTTKRITSGDELK